MIRDLFDELLEGCFTVSLLAQMPGLERNGLISKFRQITPFCPDELVLAAQHAAITEVRPGGTA